MSSIQPCPLSREPGQSHPRRRLLRTSRDHPPRTRKDQAPDNRKPSLAASTACRIISITDDPEPPFWKPAICLNSSDDGHPALGPQGGGPPGRSNPQAPPLASSSPPLRAGRNPFS